MEYKMMGDWAVVYESNSIIQRDAILARLRSVGIPCESPQRDLSRKITENTTDLAYEGYSVLSLSTFPILAGLESADLARSEINRFLEQVNQEPSLPAKTNLERFYFSSLFSIGLPGVFHLLAVYHLIRAIQSGEKVVSLGVLLTSTYLVGTVALWVRLFFF